MNRSETSLSPIRPSCSGISTPLAYRARIGGREKAGSEGLLGINRGVASIPTYLHFFPDRAFRLSRWGRIAFASGAALSVAGNVLDLLASSQRYTNDFLYQDYMSAGIGHDELYKAYRTGYIIYRHILPNVFALVYISLATSVPGAIISEASLAWLGLGDINIPSWGVMLYDFSRTQTAIVKGLGEYWFWVIPPGIAIAAMAMAFILMGFALDEILNPRLRRRR